MSDTVEIKKTVPVVAEVDVLVVGAGIGGATAAVAAAREGATTMVVDRFGYPGGNMGPGMCGGAPDLELPPVFRDGLPGVPGEFVRRCESYGNAPLLNHYFRDSQVIAYVWLKMMEESGVQFMLNTYAADPIMESKRVTGLVVENKSGSQAIRAKVTIDATGDADVATRAGAPTDGGKGLFSPGTYFAMANVDIDRFVTLVADCEPDPEDVRWVESIDERTASMKYLRPLFPYYRAAWEAGEYRFLQPIGDLGHALCDHGIFRSVSGVQYVKDPLRIGKYGILGAMVGVRRGENPTSGDTGVMTALEVGCRKFIFETAQFLCRRVPGFEQAYLHIIAPYFNCRGGRSFVSEYPMSQEDLTECRRHDDVVFQGITHGIHGGRDAPVGYTGDTYDFPYRQLIPAEIGGLLGAGRACIVQPPKQRIRWMMLLSGQAAGVAAALSARAGVTPLDLDVRTLQRVLSEKYGVPLGDEQRLQELGLA